MKLSNLNKKLFLFIFLFLLPATVHTEENIDIWSKKNFKKEQGITQKEKVDLKTKSNKIKLTNKNLQKVEIQVTEKFNTQEENISLYGLYDPGENDFTLNMWSNSEGTRIQDTIERISKIKLSNFSEEIFVNTILTNSYLPLNNMTHEEFLKHKFEWLILNEKDELIETFLSKNNTFPHKAKLIKYLVDRGISNSNIDEACKKINFLNKDIKEPYLERFRIICLVKDKKIDEAQLILDILREQKLSDKFFDNKINFLIGFTEKAEPEVLDNNLLNFYLSSITIKDFKYIPNKKTDKFIWKYLSTANLLETTNYENKELIKELEVAANKNNYDKLEIFKIYKAIPFTLNDYLRADDVYLNLDSINARSLIYQKYLLSDNEKAKLKYLFLLQRLFKKDKLDNIFSSYLSDELELFDFQKIPEEYINFANKNIIKEEKNSFKKIKYSDSSYHTSKIIRYLNEKKLSKKTTEKEIFNVHKKIKKNKKYILSLKDAALFESLENDGFKIPKDIKYKKIKGNNSAPVELSNLVKNNEIGLFTLRLVELIGEDKITDFDDQTIYFINNLLNLAGLKKFRDRVLFTTLPLKG